MYSKDLFNVFHSIQGTNFSLYTPEQAKQISVAQLSNDIYKDKDGKNTESGIYDIRLGQSFTKCVICHKSYLDCQGHVGHIELQHFVYNPITFKFTIQLFKNQCQSCHKLRVSDHQLLIFTAQFACIRAGLTCLAQDAKMMNNDDLRKVIQQAEDILSETKEVQFTQILEQLYQNLVKELFSTRQKCPHCHQTSEKFIVQHGIKVFRVHGASNIDVDDNLDLEDDITRTFVHPGQVLEEIQLCFDQHESLMHYIFGDKFQPSALLIKNLLVTPNRLRQMQFLNGKEQPNPISSNLAKIIQTNNGISTVGDKNQISFQIIQLQKLVNSYIDSTYSDTASLPGINQRLEKKSGMFRQNMQGKRVNFAARSVISPDINLATTELGIPSYFASTLTFPEPVNQYNLEYLQDLVRNGPNYPGANMIEFSYGRTIDLTKLSANNLEAQAQLLGTIEPGVTIFVHRHVMPGDPLIFNRQPSLHRLSMLVHRARILPGHSKTIRFHYANCNGYNADFDGDEMNLHMPQTYLQVADALEIALNDEHYISATGGGPQRGLIQDSVVGGILLTKLDNFYNKSAFQQMCWIACGHISQAQSQITLKDKIELMQGKNKVTNANPFSAMTDTKFIGKFTGQSTVRTNGDGFGYLADDFNELYCNQKKPVSNLKSKKIIVLNDQVEIVLPQPAIMFPSSMYTGKQVVSVMLNQLCQDKFINIKSGNTLPPQTWGVHAATECQTQVINNELISGLVDKKHIAASANGLVHSIQEIFGGQAAGMFLTSYGRLTAYILQQRGFTCSLEDMVLTDLADKNRTAIYDTMTQKGLDTCRQFIEAETCDNQALKAGLQYKLQTEQNSGERLDSLMQGTAMEITSSLAQACHPSKLITLLPRNSLSFMILTGAKGSSVNLQMITSCLGQQSLEGRRVPMTLTGRTLPCYRPFDNIDFIPGGYVYDRFLTGIRPQSFFFHHQAGREGLIDTAVKTATSGYFQRCIIKSVEGLTVRYDGSVRDADGSIVQKLYGGDGLDPCKTSMLENFDFQSRNAAVYTQTNAIQEDSLWETSSVKNLYKIQDIINEITMEKLIQSPLKYEKQIQKLEKYYNKIFKSDLTGDQLLVQLNQLVKQIQSKPLNDILSPYQNYGVTSVNFKQKLEQYIAENPSGLINKSDRNFINNFKVDTKLAEKVAYTKYARALIAPGEAVGVLAGQSIGEPSTQLTLNTFHLAGHGAANVTLGIPRLKEIVNTAAKKPKTPLITLECIDNESAQYIQSQYTMLYLSDIVSHIKTSEKVKDQVRQYEIILSIDQELLEKKHATADDFKQAMQTRFVSQLVSQASKVIELQKANDIIQGDIQVIKKVKIQNDGVASESELSAQDESSVNSDISEVDDQEDSQEEKVLEIPDEEQIVFKPNGKFDFQLKASSKELTSASKKNIILTNLMYSNSKLSVQFTVGLDRQLLILTLIEELIYKVIIRQVKDITNCFIRKNKEKYYVDIEGNNIHAINELKLGLFIYQKMKCNDVYQVLNTLGVEAARASIIDEVHSVFDVYHISVDKRHLSIVADFMTQDGNYRAFNRGGMQQLPHILLKASFETTGKVLSQASVFSKLDNMNTASAAITVGQEIPSGTGAFELLQLLE